MWTKGSFLQDFILLFKSMADPLKQLNDFSYELV